MHTIVHIIGVAGGGSSALSKVIRGSRARAAVLINGASTVAFSVTS
jgi:ABC-type uncharacterized transport system ATPase subunit